jgi:hypothetical protein
MPWEKEYEHVDKVEMVHEVGLVEKGTVGQDGEPARVIVQVCLGGEAFTHMVGRHLIRITLGHEMALQPDGSLKDADGNDFDMRALIKQTIAHLNERHASADAYAARHRVALRKTGGGPSNTHGLHVISR